MAEKEVPNLFVSVADAALVVQGLVCLEASVKRRIVTEHNAAIKQILADDAHAVRTLMARFKI